MPDSVTLLRNSPPIVEQQGIGWFNCYGADHDPDISDCVTNTGPALWDPDDYWRGSAYDGEWVGTIYADWAQHDFYIWACRKPEHGRWATPLYATISFDPPGNHRRPSQTVTLTDVFAISNQQECVRGCSSSPDYDQELDRDLLQEIPLQGGGGNGQGFAVPTTVTVTSNGTISLTAELDSTKCMPGW